MKIRTHTTRIANVLSVALVLAALLTLAITPGTVVAQGDFYEHVSAPAAISRPPEDILSASQHTCGLRPDGSADCWGLNDFGQATGQPGPFTQISAGRVHTCGLKPDSSVDCWGNNDYGQATDQPGPFTQISAGADYTCGLKPDGSLDCWGWNGLGEATDQPGPFIQISTGEDHTCGLKPDGSVDCWGNDVFGQAMNQPGPFIQISAGYIHTCGLKPDRSVECWGQNLEGEATDQPGPFTRISAGGAHTCGLKPDGSVDCWGWNVFGQATDHPGPFIRISAGPVHTCGLKPDGSIDCWGSNSLGQATDQPGPFGPSVPDSTSPVITATFTGTVGNGDWYLSDVTVSWSAIDDESYITSQSGCEPTTVNTDTPGTTVTCTANSPGGTTSESVTVKRDATLPVVALVSRTPAANANGWNNTDVLLTWSCSDALSGVTSANVSQTVSTEGQNQSSTSTCTDNAGNTASDTQTGINIDKTAPTLNPTVSPNPVLWGGSATSSGNASDALSGLASESCGTVDTSAVGYKTVACTATDQAGNLATLDASYQVIYDFTGFLSPVDNLPVMNTVKAGQIIPVKFSLAGNQGLSIFAAGSPKVQQIACDSGAPGDAIEETSTSGSSGLQYDPATDMYTYFWKTQKSWSGACRQLILRLADGTEHIANFQFK